MCSGCRLLALVLSALCAGVGASCAAAEDEPAVAVAPPRPDVPVGPVAGVEANAVDEEPNPFAEDEDAMADGRRFFLAYNCAGCHGDHGGGGMGPSLRDEAWIYGGSHAQIADSIAEGRAFGMPSWEKMLTPAQIWQITAYLRSMRTTREPQAPAGN
jgi:cytochrome c oxidase cbb3-type subunit III